MKTTRPLIVSIPHPCSQRLHDMTQVKEGRYCSECRKTVIDFSLLTDAAISHRLQQANGEVCGMFLPSQLNRPLEVAPKKRWLPVALLTGLLSGGSLLSLQAKNLSPASLLIPGSTDASAATSGEPDSLRVIKGNVSAENIPLGGATVVLKDTKHGVVTDSAGNFTLTIPDTTQGKTFTIIISFVAFYPIELTATTDMPVAAVLQPYSPADSAKIGYVVRVVKPTRWGQLKRDWRRLWHIRKEPH
ncbi:carboxypeptidase-like regulatory domain-containing protein [Chitinophaga nivalis]|uniref:Carboxypeptidase-like regulatory domain-containing protein n=1 Tax=Chitinophaga nivalis TaxID=2991709 RepID=A0ABT3IKE4_9BACT|nr:carboxypeptidase-like regulatory domain-containing protein [Chitinophaga nivalis]MCW3465873.1 carboxypeptidase-like regulatory domain-containing protein [Chitinophaga nivalis]MCW3484436.1 carboxypeptidase-like regulatory domain-containing protein [Chitinophaga nivalis]